MLMNPIQVCAFLFGLMLALVTMDSICIAKERDAENCTTSHNTKPQVRISACTRILKATEAFGDFGNVAALSNRASAYFQTGNYDRALRDLNVAVDLIEKLGTKIDELSVGRMIAAGIYGNRGIIYLALDRRPEAATDFKKALSIEPTVIEKYKEALRHLAESD